MLLEGWEQSTHEIIGRAVDSLSPGSSGDQKARLHKVTIRTIDHGAPKSAPLAYSVVSFPPQCPAVLVEGRLARRCQCHGRRILCFTSMRPHVGPQTCRRFAGHAARRTAVDDHCEKEQQNSQTSYVSPTMCNEKRKRERCGKREEG